MPITRPPYPPQFRQQIVDLVRAGRDPVSLSSEFEPTAETIRKWLAAAGHYGGDREEKDTARAPAPASAGGANGALGETERDELARLRRENRQLRV